MAFRSKIGRVFGDLVSPIPILKIEDRCFFICKFFIYIPGSQAGMGYGTEIPGPGTGIRTDYLGTLGTGTNIAGTIPRQKWPRSGIGDFSGAYLRTIFNY